MNTAIQSKLIQIGNSRGVRLPVELIERAGLNDELELIARDGEILISNRRHPRQGWADAYGQNDELSDEDADWLGAPLAVIEEEA
jgi:antitoxin MazE